jgi:hypothetical protein
MGDHPRTAALTALVNQWSLHPEETEQTLAALGATFQPAPAVVAGNQGPAAMNVAMQNEFALLQQQITDQLNPFQQTRDLVNDHDQMLGQMNASIAVLHLDFIRRYNTDCWNSNVDCNEDWKVIKWPHNPAGQIPADVPRTLGELNNVTNPILNGIIGAYELVINLTGMAGVHRRVAKLRAVKEHLKIPVPV